MTNHREPDLWIDGVPQNGDKEEKAEKKHIQGEDGDRYPIEPYPVVWQVVEKN